MTIPAWLRGIGKPGPRGAATHHCRTCKAPILTGLDEDMAAFHTTADTTPLSPLGEALALLAGRRTYELKPHGQGFHMRRRSSWQIETRIASEKHLIVADHECGASPLPSIPVPKPAPKAKVSNSPPF